MPRYIDAEAMLKRCKELTDNSTITRAHLIVDASRKWFEAFIKTQPTVDVAEVKHAHWIPDDKTDDWRCSECSYVTNEKFLKCYRGSDGIICYQLTNPFYCSKCGAKMAVDDETDKRN